MQLSVAKMLFVWLVMFLVVKQAGTEDVTHENFKIMKGYSITGGTVLNSKQRADMSAIKCASECTVNCGIVMYNKEQNSCISLLDRFQESTFNLTESSEWDVIYKYDPVTVTTSLTDVSQNWTLVFRVDRTFQKSVYGYWSTFDSQEDNSSDEFSPVMCTHTNRACRNSRSSILNNWRNIDKVKYSMYKSGKEVINIIFDGRNTTNESWFDKTRILSSSWKNLKNSVSPFYVDLKGFEERASRRTFRIFAFHRGCSNDMAYTFILERAGDTCTSVWPNVWNETVPIFLYSKDTRASKLTEGGFEKADMVAVFVTFIVQ